MGFFDKIFGKKKKTEDKSVNNNKQKAVSDIKKVESSKTTKKKCPNCGRNINETAINCRFCGYNFNTKTKPKSSNSKKQQNKKEIKQNKNVNNKCTKYAKEFKEQYLAKSLEFLITSMNWMTECPEDANAKYAFIIAQTASDLISKGEIEKTMALRLYALFQVAEVEQPGDTSLHEFYRNEAKALIDTMKKNM